MPALLLSLSLRAVTARKRGLGEAGEESKGETRCTETSEISVVRFLVNTNLISKQSPPPPPPFPRPGPSWQPRNIYSCSSRTSILDVMASPCDDEAE